MLNNFLFYTCKKRYIVTSLHRYITQIWYTLFNNIVKNRRNFVYC